LAIKSNTLSGESLGKFYFLYLFYTRKIGGRVDFEKCEPNYFKTVKKNIRLEKIVTFLYIKRIDEKRESYQMHEANFFEAQTLSVQQIRLIADLPVYTNG